MSAPPPSGRQIAFRHGAWSAVVVEVGGAIRELRQDIEMGARRQGQVIDGIGRGDRFSERGEGPGVPMGNDGAGALVVEVVDASDREISEAVRGEVGVGDDAAGADDDDRLGRGWARPGLAQGCDIGAHAAAASRLIVAPSTSFAGPPLPLRGGG